ncbi:hypothetical protein CAEBREN_29825, partial [Caenorhabditis brenneri]
ADGNACIDVNECEGEIKVCSPLVKCHNTLGSYWCDSCPAGYTGDGRNCVKDDACSKNKCHKLATCKETDDSWSVVGDYTCYCPDGYVGDGVGEEGCVKSSTTVCQDHKCVNGGKCKPTSLTEYQCACESGFLGKFCEKTSPCQTNPCENGGTCVPVDNLAYCECPEHFFGRTCSEEEESEFVLTSEISSFHCSDCGAHFSHPTGNYTFNMEKGNKTESSICDFTFNIPAANSAVRIIFTYFDDFIQEGSGSTDCATTNGNLTLYDGSSDTAPEFATFCGSSHSVHAPLSDTPITMTSTGAMLRFRGTQGTFSIAWETIERACGYRTSKPEGILSVPQNKQDIVCEWFISAPGGKIIEVTIPAITMHSKDSNNCDQNSLEIYDGYSTNDRHRILETCSSTVEQQVVKSTGPFLSVSFISNMLQSVSGLETIRGFALTYKIVTPDRECGGEIDNVEGDFQFSGVIESPNYGSLYPPNMDCTWKINGSLGNNSYSADMVLKLTFDEFDVKSGFSANGPLMHDRSFRRLYPIGSELGAAGFSRILAFRQALEFGTCTNDYLKIHDGDGQLVQEACNPRRPPSLLTVNNPAAVLTFHSDDSDQGKGFRIQYEMVCQKRVNGNGTIQTWNFPNGGPAAQYSQSGGFQSKKIFGFSGHFTTLCSGIILDGISGNIQSPGYPYKVYTKQYCTWTIRVPKGNRIRVDMHHFSISQNLYHGLTRYCEGDVLKVDDTDLGEAEVTFQNNQYNTTTTVNKYCVMAIPKIIRSKHNTMKLTYSSSSDPTNQFWLSWSTIGCSRDISSPQELIITKENIDPEVDEFECQYKITAPVGKQINLNVTLFDILPTQSDCAYSKDSTFNGFALFMGNSNASGAPFQTFCTASSQLNVTSHGSELFILMSVGISWI